MKRYVSMDKRSKKEQRAAHAAKRGSWGGLSPMTKIVLDKTKYSRSLMKRKIHKDNSDY